MAQRGTAQASQLYRQGKSSLKKDNGGTAEKLPSRTVTTRRVRSNASSSSTLGRSPNIRRSENIPPAQSPSPSPLPHEPPPVDLSDCAPAERGRGGSRRVKRWLAEQQRVNENNITLDASSSEQIAKAAGTPCNPYLAYPYLAHYASAGQNDDDDKASLHSYVIVEEEAEGAERPTSEQEDAAEVDRITVPRTSVDTDPDDLFFQPPYAVPPASSTRGMRPSSISSALPWRNRPFSKTLPSRPASTICSPSMPTPTSAIPQSPPHTPKKNIPILRRRSPIPEGFRLSVGGSSSTKDKGEPSTPRSLRFSPRSAQKKVSSSTIVPASPGTPKASMRFRLSSLAQSATSSPGMDPNSPRPSTSASSEATTATSTAVENDEQSMASRLRTKLTLRLTKKASKLSSLSRSPMSTALEPITTVDSPSRASFSSSTQTIDSPFAPPGPQLDSASFLAPPQMLFSKDQTQHHSLSKKDSQSIFREKGRNASSSALSTLSIGSIGSYATSIGGRSNVFAGATSGRRKRLVVSGIERDNWDAIEGLQKWCEKFGELRQITRMPNGDLHVDFKRSEVADTVCRLSARVFISGVGSVHLSWITGKKR